MIERSRVPIPAGTAGEYFFSGSTLSVLLFSVTVPSPCYRSSTYMIPVILPKVQVAGYS